MKSLCIFYLVLQSLGSKLFQLEDYNTISNKWCIQDGQSGTNAYNQEIYLGGQGKFKDQTVLQNYYYLENHYQVTFKIQAIFSICIQTFSVQLDDVIQNIDIVPSIPQPVNLEVGYFHTSKSGFLSLQVTKLPNGCSNSESWWGIFAIQIYLQNCLEDKDYCQPGSNNKWILLDSSLYYKQNEWNQINFGLNSQTFKCIIWDKYYLDFRMSFQSYFNNYRMQKYVLIPYPTRVRFQFKLIFENQPYRIEIKINDFSTLWPVNNNLILYSKCNSLRWWVYNIEIDIHNHKSDQLSISLIFMENVGSNEVSIFDFNVYYQNQDIIEPAKLGCLKMINQQCFFCELGWQFDIVQQDCIPICGNKIEQAYEECDDGNDIANDGCYNCKFECSLDCQDCYFGKCLVQQNSNDIEQYDTLKKIQDCQNSKGYYFDILSNDCQSICGDQIITLQEECDDGNYQFNDGCMNCKFICSDECLNCQFGKCYQCNPGYKIIQFKCIPNCGDQLIIADEKCDDGNNIPFDGCYKCQSSCQLECIICQNSYCIECLQGWNLIEGLCEQRCGDQQVALMSNEQCDDLSNNNCVDCSYSFCQINCQICNQHQCVSCIYPFQLIDGLCQPICGDSIITPEYEECDDGNDIPFDGCYQCQYSCSYGCISCTKNNICNQCDQNLFILDNFTSQCKQINSIIYNNNNEYPLIDSLYNINNTSIRCYQNYILIDNICVNQCGNGQLNSFYEECDDGNNHGGDGCSSLCQLEQSFQCINIEGQLTTCSFIKPSDFNLISLSDKANQTQIIELTFTQQVKLIYPSQLQEIIVFKISPEITHELTIIPIQNLTIDLNNPIYQIIIYFQQSIENPILEVEISKFQIFDQYDQGLLNFNKNISLGNPFVISESTKQQVVTIVKLNDAMMYSMASIAGLALLTGNMLMILNLLDLLQSLSYIRFMQYQFPPHLRLFLDTYTKVSLQPILDYFKVDEIITQLNGGLLPYKKKKSSNFNSNYALNSFYLINAKSCYFSLLASLLTYIICSAISSQIINQKLSNYYLKYQQKLKFLKLLSIFQAKVQFQCLKIKNNYFSLGIFQLYFTILHQLSFSTFIQFPDYTFQSVFEFFNSINAAIALIMILFCCLKMLSITSASIRNISKWKYFYLGSKTQFWAINFKSFQIFRIKFYIFIIVICMNYPQIQSILLSVQSLFYLIYLYKFRPLNSNFDLVKLILRESLLIVIFSSFLLYSFDYNKNQFLLIGWIHIYLFSLILSSSLIVDMIEYIQKIHHNYIKKKMLEKQREQNKYFDNPLQRFILIEQQNKIH